MFSFESLMYPTLNLPLVLGWQWIHQQSRTETRDDESRRANVRGGV